MNIPEVKPRFYYFDLLRCIAIIAVILLHNSADPPNLYGKIPMSGWLAACSYNGLTRFCVPMFVVLSGALLLKRGREITLKELFSKRLPKLVVPLVIWSIVYVVYANYPNGGLEKLNIGETLKAFYKGPVVFHFWFLYMMIGIYLASPIINLFINSAAPVYIKYFLGVWFVTNCVLGIIENAFDLPIGIDLGMFTGYIGYFVLGYYLQNFIFSARALKTIYLFAVAAFIMSIAGIILLHVFHFGHANEIIESDMTPEIPFAIAGLFLWVKNRTNSLQQKQTPVEKVVSSISRESYGIYIVHILVARILFSGNYILINLDNISIAWSIPLKVLMILVLSYGLVKLLRLLPFSRFII